MGDEEVSLDSRRFLTVVDLMKALERVSPNCYVLLGGCCGDGLLGGLEYRKAGTICGEFGQDHIYLESYDVPEELEVPRRSTKETT
jgi:hypothetical protein